MHIQNSFWVSLAVAYCWLAPETIDSEYYGSGKKWDRQVI